MRVLRFRDPNEDVKPPTKLAKVEFTPFEEKKEVLDPKDWQPSDPTYLNFLQDHTLPSPQALSRHPSLSPECRSLLLDWLHSACSEFHLARSTLHKAILICDFHLQHSSLIPQSRYQLLGLACLYIAIKVEESWIPPMSEVLYAAGDTFTERELLEVERKVLVSAQWRLPRASLEDWIQWGMQQWDYFYAAIGGCSASFYGNNQLLAQTVQRNIDQIVLKWEVYEYESSLLAATLLYQSLLGLGTETNKVQLTYWTFADKVFAQKWSEKVPILQRFLRVC